MLKVQFLIRKVILFVKLSGELDQSSVEKLRVRVSELVSNYNIVYIVF